MAKFDSGSGGGGDDGDATNESDDPDAGPEGGSPRTRGSPGSEPQRRPTRRSDPMDRTADGNEPTSSEDSGGSEASGSGGAPEGSSSSTSEPSGSSSPEMESPGGETRSASDSRTERGTDSTPPETTDTTDSGDTGTTTPGPSGPVASGPSGQTSDVSSDPISGGGGDRTSTETSETTSSTDPGTEPGSSGESSGQPGSGIEDYEPGVDPNVRDQAEDLEQEFIEQTPGVTDESQVRVVWEDQEEGVIRTELTDSGERSYVENQVAEETGLPEDTFNVVRTEDGGFDVNLIESEDPPAENPSTGSPGVRDLGAVDDVASPVSRPGAGVDDTDAAPGAPGEQVMTGAGDDPTVPVSRPGAGEDDTSPSPGSGGEQVMTGDETDSLPDSSFTQEESRFRSPGNFDIEVEEEGTETDADAPDTSSVAGLDGELRRGFAGAGADADTQESGDGTGEEPGTLNAALLGAAPPLVAAGLSGRDFDVFDDQPSSTGVGEMQTRGEILSDGEANPSTSRRERRANAPDVDAPELGFDLSEGARTAAGAGLLFTTPAAQLAAQQRGRVEDLLGDGADAVTSSLPEANFNETEPVDGNLTQRGEFENQSTEPATERGTDQEPVDADFSAVNDALEFSDQDDADSLEGDFEPGDPRTRDDVESDDVDGRPTRADRRENAEDVDASEARAAVDSDLQRALATGVSPFGAAAYGAAQNVSVGRSDLPENAEFTTREDARGPGSGTATTRAAAQGQEADAPPLTDLVDEETAEAIDAAVTGATLGGEAVAGVASDVDDTLQERGTAEDPQATFVEREVRDQLGDPGAGVRRRGSGLRNILQEDVAASEEDVQELSQEVAAGIAASADPTREGPNQEAVEELNITTGPPPGFGLFGPAKTLRGASVFVRALRRGGVSGGSTRAAPSASRVGRSIGRQGQFAQSAVNNLIRNTGIAATAVGAGVSQSNELPTQEPTQEVTEIEPGETVVRSELEPGTDQVVEVPVDNPEAVRNDAEISVPDSVDESEVRITEDGDVEIPAEATSAAAQERYEEEEEEEQDEDEEEDEEEAEEEEVGSEEIVIEFPEDSDYAPENILDEEEISDTRSDVATEEKAEERDVNQELEDLMEDQLFENPALGSGGAQAEEEEPSNRDQAGAGEFDDRTFDRDQASDSEFLDPDDQGATGDFSDQPPESSLLDSEQNPFQETTELSSGLGAGLSGGPSEFTGVFGGTDDREMDSPFESERSDPGQVQPPQSDLRDQQESPFGREDLMGSTLDDSLESPFSQSRARDGLLSEALEPSIAREQATDAELEFDSMLGGLTQSRSRTLDMGLGGATQQPESRLRDAQATSVDVRADSMGASAEASGTQGAQSRSASSASTPATSQLTTQLRIGLDGLGDSPLDRGTPSEPTPMRERVPENELTTGLGLGGGPGDSTPPKTRGLEFDGDSRDDEKLFGSREPFGEILERDLINPITGE